MALIGQELRPNADYATADVAAINGGSEAHEVLDDDTDSTYVAMGDVDVFYVDVATFTIPDGARLVSAALGITSETDTGLWEVLGYLFALGGTIAYGVQPGTAVGGYPDWTTLATYPAALTQAAVDSLRAQVVFRADSSTPAANASFDELRVLVRYWEQPTCTVTNPTGTISTTSFPEVIWTSTNLAATGGLVRYQVKIFDDATYGAGGFDPDTATPVYDSGEKIGPGVSGVAGYSHTPTTPIGNSDTYKAYVRVAHSPSGLHWSEWDDGPAFTMSLTQPDPPSISITESAATASVDVDLTRDDATDWEYVEVRRRNTTTGETEFVRGATAVPADTASTHSVTDYEPPTRDEDWVYEARVFHTVSAELIASDWETSAEVLLALDDVWLKDPADPTLNTTVRSLDRLPSDTAPARRGVFDVANRADPVVVSETRPPGEVTYQCATTTDDDRVAVEAILATGRTLYIDTPDDDDLAGYVAVGNYNKDRGGLALGDPERVWRLPLLRVARPSDDESLAALS